ncbi:IS5 family transposase [Streptomyces sp. NPDC059009]|uniref:IS5 family transposase n=1 Tax=Streptomyces sp. NPDC059009 TaxID=3346694 RepID=UPI003683F05C
MLGRGDLTDDEWAVLEALLPRSNNRCGRWRDHRQLINGIIHRLGTGCQWCELPERFGPWQTIHRRHMLWSADGTWERLPQYVQAGVDAAGGIDWNSTPTPRRCAPTSTPPGPKGPTVGTSGSSKGAAQRSVHVRAHVSLCPLPGGGGAPGEALGRSRGGLTCKLHLSADGKCRPLPLAITPGQRVDCTQFEPVMDKIRVPRIGSGRSRRLPDSVGADKAYSNGLVRSYLRRRGIRHVIPEKSDTKSARLRRGSSGGRPSGFDKTGYKARNTVERAINKLKRVRAVATRYDKRGYVFLGT